MSVTKSDPASEPLEPSTQEHGVWGTKNEAVGGFGESYDAQVASGSEPNLPTESEQESELADAVRKALARAHVDAADLRVEVSGHRVTLDGTVRHDTEKLQLESRARAVPGVAAFISHLVVASSTKPSTPG